MPEATAIINTNVEDVVQLLDNDEIASGFKEAESAVMLNPAVTWAKFVLTDSLPNKNKQRVPESEFQNLIKSGIYMPIKMARGKINDGHGSADPLGVITNLTVEGNAIVGLAALWSEERRDDIKLLKERSKNKQPTNLSWEIIYTDSRIDENGVEELLGTSLKASTIVGMPAYGGRTPILAIAAKGSPAYLDELPDSAFLFTEDSGEGKIRKFPFRDKNGDVDKEALASLEDDIQNSTLTAAQISELVAKVAELAAATADLTTDTEDNTLDELETLRQEVLALKASLESAQAILTEKETAFASQAEELLTLREFKSGLEAEASKQTKLEEIKTRFAEAKIAKSEEYFKEHEDFLLGVDEQTLQFMLQELVSFASAAKQSQSSVEIPNIVTSDEGSTLSVKELAQALRARRK
jgi:hypothetical protein